MVDLAGKAAFVTGGASGIGLALGRVLAEAGVRVMLADVEAAALDVAAASLQDLGPEVRGVVCDVRDPAAVDAATAAAVMAFGRLNILCANAGVGGGGGIDPIVLDDWRWVLDVNLFGVLNTVRAALPHLRESGEAGHVLFTASIAGMVSPFGFSPYAASKFALVAIAEGLAVELDGTAIGVSVLCPGWAKTRITESQRNRPASYGPAGPPSTSPLAVMAAQLVRTGMEPDAVARHALAGIQHNELYIFTHPEMRSAIDQRFRRIIAAYDRTAPAAPGDGVKGNTL